MQPEEIVRKILEIRGIVSSDDVREFLSNKPQLIHDPELMPGMKEGAEYLFGALSDGKRICIYGDYDVDGVLGTVMLVSFLRETARLLKSGSVITYYIPSRIDEGYGLNEGAIRSIKNEGADVIVTVDCGSVSKAEAAFALETGLGILITDHHDPDPEKLPDCVLINPKLKPPGGGYPFEKLAGAGVAFKLCAALLTLAGEEESSAAISLRSSLRGMIDLVCVATIADVMPLIDENRTFVKYGLSKLRKGSRPAFNALLEEAGVDPAGLTARDVAFVIAPRLNALGRLDTAEEAVEFFLADDDAEINEMARRMDRLNTERRRIQEECFSECVDLAEEGSCFLLLKPENSHEGVAGIVAGKVREATGLPCAVLSESQDEKGLLKGSVRSVGRLDVISLLRKHGGLFEKLGGHAAAAGFTITCENEDALREALSADVAGMLEIEPDLLQEAEEAELEIDAADVTIELAEALEEIAPFGAGNPKPSLLLSVPADRITNVRTMGQDGKHLRFAADGVPCVYFSGAGTRFTDKGSVKIIGCPEINLWNGYRNIQFAVRHIDVL